MKKTIKTDAAVTENVDMNIGDVPEQEVPTRPTLADIMAQKDKQPSLKAFALVLDLPVNRLTNIAKRPIAGQVYDPSAKNWAELDKFFAYKLAQEGAVCKTMDELVDAAVEKDEWLATNSAHVATGNNTIDVDGGKMPKRKAACLEMGSEKESLLCFKHDPLVYKMVYQTTGYTVIRAVNKDGQFEREEVRVISNGTMNTKIVPPAMLEKAIAERFSGEYAKAVTVEIKAATGEEPINMTAEQ